MKIKLPIKPRGSLTAINGYAILPDMIAERIKLRLRKYGAAVFILLLFTALSGCPMSDKVMLELQGMEADKLDPDAYATYSFSMAMLDISQGDYEGAVKHLNDCLSIDPNSAYLHRTLAKTLALMGKLEKAEQEAKTALELDPSDADSYLTLGTIYLKAEKAASAETVLKRGRVKHPLDEQILITLAEALLNQGKAEDAVLIMNEYLHLNPQSPTIHYLLGQVYLNLGHGPQAEAQFKKALEYDPAFYMALRDLRDIYIASEQYGKAARVLHRLLYYYPQDIDFRTQLAQILISQKNFEQALNVLERGKAESSDWPEWWITSAQIYMHQKKLGLARLEYEDLLLRQPQDPQAHFFLGLLDLKQDDIQSAIQHFSQITPESEIYPEAVKRLAYLYFKQDSTDQAISLLRKAVKHYPQDPALYLQLSELFAYNEQYEDAQKFIGDGLKLNPENQDLMYQHAMVYELMGRHEKAIEQMQKLLELDPGSARALNFIGYTMADNNFKLDEAEAYIRQALDLEPDASYIQDSMGWVCYRKGDLEQALFWLLKAYEQSAEDPEVNEHMGDIYRDMGDTQKAREFYEKALEKKSRKVLEIRIRKKLEELL